MTGTMIAPPSKPQGASRPVRDEGEERRAFALLRQEMARKKTMEGHTLSDSREHFVKNTPKSARRSGLLPHSRFIIAVQRLGVNLDADQINIITSALDSEGTGVVDPTAFLQEAHNHRHHDRFRQRGQSSLHLVSPRSQLAPPTWISPRAGRYTANGLTAGGLSGAFTARRAAPQPSVVTVTSRDGLSRFASNNSTEWIPPANYVVHCFSAVRVASPLGNLHVPANTDPLAFDQHNIRSDFLIKGGGRLASPSADVELELRHPSAVQPPARPHHQTSLFLCITDIYCTVL